LPSLDKGSIFGRGSGIRSISTGGGGIAGFFGGDAVQALSAANITKIDGAENFARIEVIITL
jgi:hypothetical protein